jgi:hypothetical protein
VQYHSYRFVILHRYRAGSVDGEVSPMKYDAAGVLLLSIKYRCQ